MARHTDNEDLQKAARDASNLLSARTAARRQQAQGDTGNAARNASESAGSHGAARGKHSQGDSAQGGYKRVSRPAQAHARQEPPRKMTLSEFVAANAVYIVGVAAVVAIVVVLLVAVRSCVPTETYDFNGTLDFLKGNTTQQEEPERKSEFSWEHLEWTDEGRAVYVDDGQVLSRTGIDVSENQGVIDWEAVAADGIDFAIIRLGYRGANTGELYTDQMFAANLEGAKAAGVACGVYFFSQATTAKEAREEADFIIKRLGDATLEFPVVLDFETAVAGVESPRAANLGKDRMTEIADAFCKRIEKAGLHSMIYGNYYDLDLYNYESLQNRAIWWAEYDAWQPSPSTDIIIWQYSNGGSVSGIQTAVDMNIDFSGAL